MRAGVDRAVERVHRDRQHVVRADRVRRGRRRDLDVRVHERLHRIRAVRRDTVGRDRERRRTGHRQRCSSHARSPCPSSFDVNDDRALARRVRVRTRIVTGARSRVEHGVAPPAGVNVKSTCSPGSRDEAAPSPMSFSSVTVNVCGWPTSFVAFGVIWILAFTHRFVAGPEFAARAVRVPRQRDAADRHRRVRRHRRHTRHRRGAA